MSGVAVVFVLELRDRKGDGRVHTMQTEMEAYIEVSYAKTYPYSMCQSDVLCAFNMTNFDLGDPVF